MATQPTDTTPAASRAPMVPKPVNVIDGMESRRMFANVEEAAAYLNAESAKYADFNSVPQVIRGMIESTDEEGNISADFDPAIYTPDTRVMVALLANRGEINPATKERGPSTVKAIVVTPVPTLEAILADPAGLEWAQKIIDKELNHVAVRPLRTADDVDTVADQMPLTLADYVTSSRESTGGIMETFNSMFKGIIATVGQKSTAWAKYRLTKSDLKRAMESKAFALEWFPTLEDRGLNAKTGQPFPSLFVMALQLGEREAVKQGLDPAIFRRWLDTRDQKALTVKVAEEESDDFDLDDLAYETPKATDSAAPATPDAAPAAPTE